MKHANVSSGPLHVLKREPLIALSSLCVCEWGKGGLGLNFCVHSTPLGGTVDKCWCVTSIDNRQLWDRRVAPRVLFWEPITNNQCSCTCLLGLATSSPVKRTWNSTSPIKTTMFNNSVLYHVQLERAPRVYLTLSASSVSSRSKRLDLTIGINSRISIINVLLSSFKIPTLPSVAGLQRKVNLLVFPTRNAEEKTHTNKKNVVRFASEPLCTLKI